MKKTVQQWLADPAIFTTSILTILLDEYETMEFVQWDPSTIEMQFRSDFRIEPPPFLLNRTNAGCALLSGPLFHRSLEVFSQLCNSLNMGAVSSEVLIPADLDDVMWGVTEAMLLEGNLFKEEGFSHSIARYVGVLLSREGIQDPPSVLQFAEYSEREQQQLEDNLLIEDPIFSKLYWETQHQQKDDLEMLNQRKLLLLFEQLNALPIKNMAREGLQKQIKKLQRATGAAA